MPSLFGTIKTFGFFVAMAFLLAAWLLKKELERKEKVGFLRPELVPFKKGQKYLPKEEKEKLTSETIPVYPHQRVGEIVVIALIGGLIGAKISMHWKHGMNLYMTLSEVCSHCHHLTLN